MSKFIERYRTDPRFYLYYRHKDMRARVAGKTAGDGKSQLWLGLEVCDRDEFIDWAVNDANFKLEWEKWEESNWTKRGPTAHRIDRTVGYLISNIQYVNHAEKSRQHLLSGQKKGKKNETT
jgi:hypothetical protein